MRDGLRSNLKNDCPFYSNWDHQVFQFYLEKFDLPINKSIKTFSTGMKMKLSLAVAFSHHAELYILMSLLQVLIP